MRPAPPSRQRQPGKSSLSSPGRADLRKEGRAWGNLPTGEVATGLGVIFKAHALQETKKRDVIPSHLESEGCVSSVLSSFPQVSKT